MENKKPNQDSENNQEPINPEDISKDKDFEITNGPVEDDDEMDEMPHPPSGSKKGQGSRTPVLDNFSRDLTKMAEEGKLDPIVGRVKEIERVSQILSRRKKNNPILIGEP